MATSKTQDDDSPFIKLSAPAQRALENAGITSAQQLANYREKDVLKLHGMGTGSIPKMREVLNSYGLSFKV